MQDDNPANADTPPAEPAAERVPLQLALVYGEAVTELPQDLYIPPDALEVFLEAFEGPLDLLLYLIRKQNIDIPKTSTNCPGSAATCWCRRWLLPRRGRASCCRSWRCRS